MTSRRTNNFLRWHKPEIIISSAILILIFIIVLACLLFIPGFRTNGFSSHREIEYKSNYEENIGEICYGGYFDCKEAKTTVSGEVDTSKLGDYEIDIIARYEDKERDLKQIVSVVDKTPPEITIEGDELMVCPDGKIQDFEYSAFDNYDGDITDKVEMNYNDWSKVVDIDIRDSNDNSKRVTKKAIVGDDKAPEITLNGSDIMVVAIGENYEELGATAIDNCNEVEVWMEGEVKTDTEGTYTIKYNAVDEAGNLGTKERTVNVMNPSGIVYLTFDDGPGPYTAKLLDVLAKYNVKATFFVTGAGDDSLIRREYDEGHAVGLHSLSHNYSYIYSSIDNFLADLTAVQDRVRNITGQNSNLMRFPGGSSNLISRRYDKGSHIMSKLVKEVEARGFLYFDWNILSGDAGDTTSTDVVYENVINNLKYGGSSVVLQHDIKEFSVDAVEGIIRYGISHGFRFDKLDADSFTAHHGVNN